ncbi:unnamed protein product [Rotaria socialis]
MIYLSVLLIIPTVISISLNCYSNAGVTLPSNAGVVLPSYSFDVLPSYSFDVLPSNTGDVLPSNVVLQSNLTLESCQCFFIQQNTSCFQYDTNTNSCYTFNINFLQAILRIQLNSLVCFINNTSTLYPVTIPATTSLPPSPISTSISITGNNYYQIETIFLNNSISLTTLLVVITVPKTFGLSGPSSYTNFWSNTVTNNITDMNATVIYRFQLIDQNTIVPGTWGINVQFNLNGAGRRPTSNDTYSIQVGSYPEIYGHF